VLEHHVKTGSAISYLAKKSFLASQIHLFVFQVFQYMSKRIRSDYYYHLCIHCSINVFFTCFSLFIHICWSFSLFVYISGMINVIFSRLSHESYAEIALEMAELLFNINLKLKIMAKTNKLMHGILHSLIDTHVWSIKSVFTTWTKFTEIGIYSFKKYVCPVPHWPVIKTLCLDSSNSSESINILE
jgi:hypothetical protein